MGAINAYLTYGKPKFVVFIFLNNYIKANL